VPTTTENISRDYAEVREALCQQLQLLAKRSADAPGAELPELTAAMCNIFRTLWGS
jgi:hypothetical protein